MTGEILLTLSLAAWSLEWPDESLIPCIQNPAPRCKVVWSCQLSCNIALDVAATTWILHLGVISSNSSISILPTGSSSAEISKNTFVLFAFPARESRMICKFTKFAKLFDPPQELPILGGKWVDLPTLAPTVFSFTVWFFFPKDETEPCDHRTVVLSTAWRRC